MSEVNQSLESISFKDGMKRLEAIVSDLESGDMELEKSLNQYAEGVKLLGELQARLNAAEQQVQVLMGELADAPDDEVQDTTLLKA